METWISLWPGLVFLLIAIRATAKSGDLDKDVYFLRTSSMKTMGEVVKRIRDGGNAIVVPKTVFNDTVRFLFVAGVEGSGHQTIETMLRHCLEMDLCKYRLFLNEVLFENRDHNHLNFGLFGAADSLENNRHIDSYSQRLGYILKMWAHHPGYLNIIGLGGDRSSGNMAYPNNHFTNSPDTQQALDKPDLVPLAALTNSAGADLRILVLFRSAREIFRQALRHHSSGGNTAAADGGSSTDSRGIMVRTLIDNQVALRSQLSYLDPRFLFCVRVEDLATFNASQRAALGHFLHPKLTSDLLDDMWTRISSGAVTTSPLPKSKPLVNELSVNTISTPTKEQRYTATNHASPPPQPQKIVHQSPHTTHINSRISSNNNDNNDHRRDDYRHQHAVPDGIILPSVRSPHTTGQLFTAAMDYDFARDPSLRPNTATATATTTEVSKRHLRHTSPSMNSPRTSSTTSSSPSEADLNALLDHQLAYNILRLELELERTWQESCGHVHSI